MPFDAIYLTALLEELRGDLVGAKIDKIRQPERDEIILALRLDKRRLSSLASDEGAPASSLEGGTDVRRNLLISAGASDARLHFTAADYENPAAPPMFCMLLRKHLIGAKIIAVQQPEGERMAMLTLAGHNAFGEVEEKKLVAEMMGRNSNIILVDAEGIIVDCLRRTDMDASPRRPVLPGLRYHLPPKPENGEVGVAPLIRREIEFRGSSDFLLELPRPVLLREQDGKIRDFTHCIIMQYGESVICEPAASFSELLERFYTRRAAEERGRSRASALTKTVRNALARTERRTGAQREELATAGNRDYLRECGDLITANFHNMKTGDERLVALDFYAEQKVQPNGELAQPTRTIKLDVRKSPQANAARYYKDYTRAKNAEKILGGQIAAGEREADYLRSVLVELTQITTERELDDVRRELVGAGYVKAEKTLTRQRVKPTAPRVFTSRDSAEILVGRNNTQNDELTFKTAFKSDIWLHVKARHGSHVILRTGGGTPSDASIEDAAALAAYYSEARDDARVAVDYCAARYVKKPAGAKPGVVIYTDYKTVLVKPKETLDD